MADKYERTPSDVREIIKYAKLHESELTPISQVLSFPEDNASFENLKFLQLDQHLMDEISSGGTVVFKGAQSDNAVLCTSTKTYDIKEAETSNSLLLIPGLLWGKQTKIDDDSSFNESTEETNISANTSLNTSDEIVKSPRNLANKEILKVMYTYLEPRPCKPHLNKLKELLQFTKYSGPEYEYTIDKKLLLSLDDLQDVIQASDVELLQGLDNIQAIEIDGHYRILSFEYEFRVLSHMLDLIDENSWPLDKIIKISTVESLKNLVPEVVLDSLFDFYTVKTTNEDGVQFYKYKEDKVCRLLAQVLLESAAKFNLSDFMQAWRDSLPEGMTANEKMLDGIALCDLESNPQMIWSFSEAKLPVNINDRLKVLFQTRQKWTVEQIAPFIERFTTDKLNVNALLTKYARGSYQNNVRYYSAKHSK